MSVILFSSHKDVFSTMAQSYEGLKEFTLIGAYLCFDAYTDYRFYKALRRLYFANVACYLCQYHDDTPLPPSDLQRIETFADFKAPQPDRSATYEEMIQAFLSAWSAVKYNLRTNDGEFYKAIDSFDHIEGFASAYERALPHSRTR